MMTPQQLFKVRIDARRRFVKMDQRIRSLDRVTDADLAAYRVTVKYILFIDDFISRLFTFEPIFIPYGKRR